MGIPGKRGPVRGRRELRFLPIVALALVTFGAASWDTTRQALAPAFLAKALGPQDALSPLSRMPTPHVAVTIDRAGYTVTHHGSPVSLAAEDADGGAWRRFANGVSRPTAFGAETVVVERGKAEEFLTVDRRQGPKTWRWTLRTSGLVPRLRDDGAVELRSGSLLIAPVALFDVRGRDVTPAGLRWSLERRSSAWQIALRLDDSNLPVPYVIDPSIVFRAASSGGNAGATTITLSKPAGVVAGDFLIAQVSVRDNPIITAPAGWTFLRRENSPALLSQLAQAIYYKFVGATEPASYTWTFSSSQNASGGIIAYTGVDTTSPIDASSGMVGTGPTATAPSVVTTAPDEMVVAFFGMARSTGLSTPAGMTERYEVVSGGGGGATALSTSMAADVVQTTPGPTGNKTSTDGATGAAWVGQLVALRPGNRTTSTTLDCPATTPANSPASCTVTVTDTDTGTKSAPAGTVDFTFTAQPAGSTASVTPDPCTLAPSSTSTSTCTVVFSADTIGSYTVSAAYSPAPATVHLPSLGSDTISVVARSTSTVLNCPASTPANSPASCTVTVTDTAAGTKSAPAGTVDFTFSSEPAGSTAAMTPNPCTLTPASASSSTCTVLFSADTVGSYTILASYNPAPASVHGASSGTDTITVVGRSTSTVLNCPASTPANSPASCTVTVTDTASGTKSAPAGTVDLTLTSQPAGSTATAAPDPCTLAPSSGSTSTCMVLFSADTIGSYTITGTYDPAPTSIHSGSSGSDTIAVVARTTSTTLDCPASTPANSAATCTVTVTDTDTGTKSVPAGTVDFSFTSQPSGSTATVAPDPCTLAPTGASSSSCTVVFSADTLGSYTIQATYDPAPTSIHAASSGTDTIVVVARSTSTTIACPASTQANVPASCTVTVTDTDTGTKSAPAGSVDFAFTSQPAGSTPTVTPDPCTLTPNSSSSSTCTVAFNSTTAGSYTIQATYNPAPASIHAASSGTDTITVTPGPPAVVTVSPPNAINTVNSQHCVTAKVTDEFGNPVPGVRVLFAVTGVNRASGSRTTGPDGTTAEFCYTGRLFGIDTIRATADTNNNGQADPTERFGEAFKEWLLPPSTPLCNVAFATNGGWITADNGDRANFGGNARVSNTGAPSGQEEYQDNGPAQPLNVHSIRILAVVCTLVPNKSAEIYGEATIDGSGSYKFRIDVTDIAEPGVGQDTYWIILETGYNSGEHKLEGGNVQIHEESA
jgi:hypothetical protein